MRHLPSHPIFPHWSASLTRYFPLQLDTPPFGETFWRRVRDSNPRYGFPYAGFQDRCHQPLGQLSAITTLLLQCTRFAPKL